MDQIYTVKGTVNKGFIGQISYYVSLENSYKELEIAFSFDKQYIEEITNQIKEDFIKAVEPYGFAPVTDEQFEDAIRMQKTEIQIIAYMNDGFVGGVHKQLADRKLYFSKEKASEGCLPVENIQGVLKVTVIFFNVLFDETNYSLTVSAQ